MLVGLGLTEDYPEANLLHYTFMLEGLLETQASLSEQGIKMVIQHGSPFDVASTLGRNTSLIVCDRGYLRHQKTWRTQLARSASCGVVQVESDVVVPIEVLPKKAEYAARTIRPKIYQHLNDYLGPFKSTTVKESSLGLKIKGMGIKEPRAILEKWSVDRSISPVTQFFKGGTSQGKARFDEFINGRLCRYVENRNQPQTDDISHMSPYLHFGHLYPLYLALQIGGVDKCLLEARDAYLEELIVRRELAMNFVNYALNYDSYPCIPQWAIKTLKQHQKDQREYTYSRGQLENAETHDEYWNAAM